MFLKIKRKQGEEPVTEIVIERPKKKAFIDSFKEFSIDSTPNKTRHTAAPLDNNINNKDKDSNGTKDDGKEELKIEKKLFTLFTHSVDEASGNKSKIEKKVEYVYDYYYLNTEDQKNIDISMIETVQLPPEDDDLFGMDCNSDSDDSRDSENWYTEYPDEEDSSAEEDERISDFDDEYVYEDEYSSGDNYFDD
eukprot:gene3654-4199_t